MNKCPIKYTSKRSLPIWYCLTLWRKCTEAFLSVRLAWAWISALPLSNTVLLGMSLSFSGPPPLHLLKWEYDACGARLLQRFKVYETICCWTQYMVVALWILTYFLFYSNNAAVMGTVLEFFFHEIVSRARYRPPELSQWEKSFFFENMFETGWFTEEGQGG